jgi:hypothetical protein
MALELIMAVRTCLIISRDHARHAIIAGCNYYHLLEWDNAKV